MTEHQILLYQLIQVYTDRYKLSMFVFKELVPGLTGAPGWPTGPIGPGGPGGPYNRNLYE